jgi:hypothetical protein
MTPHKRRSPLRPIILGLLLVGLLGWLLHSLQDCQSQQARSRIEQSLGNSSNPAKDLGSEMPSPDLLDDPERLSTPSPPETRAPNLFGEFSGEDGFPPLSGLASESAQMEEMADSYRLRVPLADKKDASQVHLNVTAHHIEISGQAGTAPKPGAAPGFSMTSSFMQSLDTSQEILPQKVHREVVERDGRIMLMITIPKAHTLQSKGTVSTPSHHENEPDFPTSPMPRPSSIPSDNVF